MTSIDQWAVLILAAVTVFAYVCRMGAHSPLDDSIILAAGHYLGFAEASITGFDAWKGSLSAWGVAALAGSIIWLAVSARDRGLDHGL